MAVRHGKMTQKRNEEILLDIKNVAEGNLIETQGKDIRIKRKEFVKVSSNDNNEVHVDMGVHFVKCHEESGLMTINIATAKATIVGANQ